MFQISDIEVGDWVLLKLNNSDITRVRVTDLAYGTLKEMHFMQIGFEQIAIDICKQNKQSQQDIISRTVKGFDLALANAVNSRIDNLIKLTEEASK